MAVTAPRRAPPPSAVRGLTSRPVAVAAACALVFALVVEVAPVVGGDLAAQAWWASWALSFGSPVDFGWYGGVPVASYSLVSPWIGALLGLPLAGILGTVLGAASTTALLGRLRPVPARWTAAGVVAAATWAADQWSGRTTFGVGAAVGTLALLVVSRPAGRGARPVGAALAVLAGATSPLASVFLLVAAAAWWCGTRVAPPAGRFRGRPAGPWWIAAGALLPVGAARLLGAVSGPEPFSTHQALGAMAATGLTWALSSPLGSNSVRLVLLFAAPVIVAVARTEWPATLLAALAVLWLLPPVLMDDFEARDTGPARERAAPLLQELAERGPVGRIEVVPMHGHEDSTEVAATFPLARGWLRQLDTVRDRLFYDGSLDAPRYLRWLRDTGASYVALPSGPLDWPAGGEAALLRRGVPGLREVWADRSWRLFEVPGGGVLGAGGSLVASDRSRMVVDVAAGGHVEVALWWSRWSSVEGPSGCIRPGNRRGWTTLVADRPGRYVLTSSWNPSGRCG